MHLHLSDFKLNPNKQNINKEDIIWWEMTLA